MHEIWDATNQLSRMLPNRALRRATSNIPKGGRARCWVAENFDKGASQTRDYCVAKSATHRAARPDPSRRKQRLLGNDKRTLRRPLLGGWALPLLSRRLVEARPFFVAPARNKELRESGGVRSRCARPGR